MTKYYFRWNVPGMYVNYSKQNVFSLLISVIHLVWSLLIYIKTKTSDVHVLIAVSKDNILFGSWYLLDVIPTSIIFYYCHW